MKQYTYVEIMGDAAITFSAISDDVAKERLAELVTNPNDWQQADYDNGLLLDL